MDNFILNKYYNRIINKPIENTQIPYPFQQVAFSELDKLKKSNPNGFSSLLVLPTGAGKTFTAVHWIIKNYINQNVKVLWIAHRSELLRQAAEAFCENTTLETLTDRKQFTSYTISSEFGLSSQIKSDDDVIIASRQSICCNIEYYIKWVKTQNCLKADRRLLIVIDEAHHATAKSYRNIISTLSKYIPHIDVLGLTATPFRTQQNEQGSLKKIFSTGKGIVYKVDMNTLISSGILSKPITIEKQTSINMSEIFNENEMRIISKKDITSLDENSLKKLTENAGRNKLIVDTYLEKKQEYGPTIVFAVDVLNAIALNTLFQSAGVKSDFIVSSIKTDMNRSFSTERNPKIINDFRQGNLEVLINVNILTEGTDLPRIKSVFLARPTTSKILMTQMIGRGLRGEAAGGTKEAFIVFFVDDWKDMVTFISPEELLNGADVIINPSEHKKYIKRIIKLSQIENFAKELYEKMPPLISISKNIIPYGIIRCNYIVSDNEDNENEYTNDILVFDEALEIYKNILADIPLIINKYGENLSQENIQSISLGLFFKYCENGDGKYIGISSDLISNIILDYINNDETPALIPFEDRVSLLDIAEEIYNRHYESTKVDEEINKIWNSNNKIKMWFDLEFFNGMIHVYLNRFKIKSQNSAEYILPIKEELDMGELKKYYPLYYKELREYVINKTKKDEEGYFYSAIQDEDKPCRSKYLKMFEMDHIIPRSRGGRTVKDNLQLILRSQNIAKGNKI